MTNLSLWLFPSNGQVEREDRNSFFFHLSGLIQLTLNHLHSRKDVLSVDAISRGQLTDFLVRGAFLINNPVCRCATKLEKPVILLAVLATSQQGGPHKHVKIKERDVPMFSTALPRCRTHSGLSAWQIARSFLSSVTGHVDGL